MLLNILFGTISLEVYPNPFGSSINVCRFADKKIIISDLAGQVLFEKKISENNSKLHLDLSRISPGIYFLRTGSSALKLIKY